MDVNPTNIADVNPTNIADINPIIQIINYIHLFKKKHMF